MVFDLDMSCFNVPLFGGSWGVTISSNGKFLDKNLTFSGTDRLEVSFEPVYKNYPSTETCTKKNGTVVKQDTWIVSQDIQGRYIFKIKQSGTNFFDVYLKTNGINVFISNDPKIESEWTLTKTTNGVWLISPKSHPNMYLSNNNSKLELSNIPQEMTLNFNTGSTPEEFISRIERENAIAYSKLREGVVVPNYKPTQPQEPNLPPQSNDPPSGITTTGPLPGEPQQSQEPNLPPPPQSQEPNLPPPQQSQEPNLPPSGITTTGPLPGEPQQENGIPSDSNSPPSYVNQENDKVESEGVKWMIIAGVIAALVLIVGGIILVIASKKGWFHKPKPSSNFGRIIRYL